MYLSTTDRPVAKTATGSRRVAGTVVALGIVSLITDVSAEMVTAVLPLYLVVGLGLSPLQFGFLDGLYTGATAIARLAGGHFADRWQRRKTVAAVGYGLSAFAKLGLLVAGSSVAAIGGVLAADRAGKGIRTAPRDALISLNSHPENLGRSFGVHRALDTTGALAGPIVAFGLLSLTVGSYDSVFVTSFCVAVLGVVVLVLFVGERAAATTSRATVSIRAAFGLLGASQFRKICICATLLGLVTVSDAFLYLLLQQRLDLAIELFPLLPLGSALTYLILAVPLGRLADRWGRWRIFLSGYLVLAVVYGLLLGPIGGLPLLIACLVLHGTYYAATDGILAAVGSSVLPDHLRSSGLALLMTGQSLGRLCASIAFGALWTISGPELALAVASIALAGVGLVVLMWRQR